MFNKDLSLATKQEFSTRITSITGEKVNKHFAMMWEYCSLYSNKSLVSTSKRYLLTPYYWLRYQLLNLRNNINNNDYPKPKPKLTKYLKPLHTAINWNTELEKASKTAMLKSTYNNFGMDNKVYNHVYKRKL